MKRSWAALVLCAAQVGAAMPTAVERGIWVQQGQTFQRQIVLERGVVGDGGKALPKGTYEIHFSSLDANKVQATFFQGGVRKGEANGIIIINSAPAPDDAKSRASARTFASVGLGPASPLTQTVEGGKLNLRIGAGGGAHILIGLLLPAVQQVREPAGAPSK